MSRVYVLIVNWNGWVDTVECLESVFRLVYPDFRVIVCDNGSSDGSFARLIDWASGRLPASVPVGDESLCRLTDPPVTKPLSYTVYERAQAEAGGDPGTDPQLILIRAGSNLGFAGGNNVGLRYILARGDFTHVWLLNNDTVVDPQALTALIERMRAKPSAGMCGSTLLRYARPNRIQARGGGWYCRWIGIPWHLGQLDRASAPSDPRHVEKWMNYVIGASLLVSRTFVEDVGLLCEDYFLFFEELDWIQRAQCRYQLAYAPDSRVYHKVGASIGTSSCPRRKSLTCDYYAVRNRLLFTRRFFPRVLPTIYLSIVFAMLHRLVYGRFDLFAVIGKILIGREPSNVKNGPGEKECR